MCEADCMKLMDVYIPYSRGKRCGVSVYAGKMFRRKKRGRWCGIRFMFYLERKDEEGDWVFTNWGFLTIPSRRVENE